MYEEGRQIVRGKHGVGGEVHKVHPDLKHRSNEAEGGAEGHAHPLHIPVIREAAAARQLPLHKDNGYHENHRHEKDKDDGSHTPGRFNERFDAEGSS